MSSQGVVIFSCARDRELADLAVSTVPVGWPVCLVIEPKDITAFQGFRAEQTIVSDFQRGQTLNGGNAVLGVLGALRLAAKQLGDPHHIAKVDSDCLLYDPTFLDPELAGAGFRGFAHHIRPGAALGLAYAMETALVDEVEAVIHSWMKVQNPATWGEDVAISVAAQVALGDPFGSDHRRPFSAVFWDRFDGSPPSLRRHIAGHYRGRTMLKKLGIIDEDEITACALKDMRRDADLLPAIIRRRP